MNKLTYDGLKEVYDGEKNLGGKPIFISFKADWWGPCRMFGKVLDEVTPEYSDKIDFYKVDVEESSELASMFNVSSLPAVTMIRKNGQKEQGVGAMNEDTLKYWLSGLIY